MQVYQETLGKQKYIYSYDKLGNIIQIKEMENGTEKVIATYAYDELNQLVRENDLYSGMSKVYTYDNGGNIREETQYPLSFDTLGTATKTIPYGYTDANWKDKMTFYDGQPVSYDAVGNPLSYRGYTMEWQNGRQLKSMTGTGLDIAYQYDSSGMRTSKTVNGEITEYYYVGGQLTYEKRRTDKELYYFYDAWGKVTSIRTPNGEKITDSEHIAYVNSIRYRLDTFPVSHIHAQSPVKSIGNSTTTPRDLTKEEDVRITVQVLCESVAERLRESRLLCVTVQIHLRDTQLYSYERQAKLPRPTANSTDLCWAACALYCEHHDLNRFPLRSVGVKACGLSLEGDAQLSLLPEEQCAEKEKQLEQTIDGIRNRFGHFSIQRGAAAQGSLALFTGSET